jgi:hypothetical protein
MTKASMLKPLSFEDAVRLFKQWGFQVEPGPRPEEVTLILEGPGHRTYAVYEASMLPQIATVAQHIRWQNGVVAFGERVDGMSYNEYSTGRFRLGG